MYILNITKVIIKISRNDVKDIIFEINFQTTDFLEKTVIIQWNTWEKKKDLLLLANKLIAKVPDPRNAIEHYQSFITKKNRK